VNAPADQIEHRAPRRWIAVELEGEDDGLAARPGRLEIRPERDDREHERERRRVILADLSDGKISSEQAMSMLAGLKG